MPGIQPLPLLLTSIVGWVHREQAATIAYRVEENRVLKEQLCRYAARPPVVHERMSLSADGEFA